MCTCSPASYEGLKAMYYELTNKINTLTGKVHPYHAEEVNSLPLHSPWSTHKKRSLQWLQNRRPWYIGIFKARYLSYCVPLCTISSGSDAATSINSMASLWGQLQILVSELRHQFLFLLLQSNISIGESWPFPVTVSSWVSCRDWDMKWCYSTARYCVTKVVYFTRMYTSLAGELRGWDWDTKTTVGGNKERKICRRIRVF